MKKFFTEWWVGKECLLDRLEDLVALSSKVTKYNLVYQIGTTPEKLWNVVYV